MNEMNNDKFFALAIVIGITVFLFYAARPYINAFFGALIFYFLFRKMYHFFNRKGLPRSISAGLIIIISLLIVIIPMIFLFSQILSEFTTLIENRENLIQGIRNIDEMYPQIQLMENVNLQINRITNNLSATINTTVQSISSFLINLIILYFLLYYLLTNSDKVESYMIDIIPFNKKNSCRLICEFNNVTYSTVVTSGLIALLQGFLLALLFFFLGIKSAILFGFIGAIVSFLPVIGISLLWIPAGVYLFSQELVIQAVIMFAIGFILSNMEYFIRPSIQNKVGRMHPLITLIGIFLGVPIFGLLGLVIGPLILSYFILTARMFRQEYYH